MGSFAVDLSLVLPDSPRPWRQMLQPQKLRPLPTGTVGKMTHQFFTEDEEENADDEIDNAHDTAATNVEEEESLPAKGISENLKTHGCLKTKKKVCKSFFCGRMLPRFLSFSGSLSREVLSPHPPHPFEISLRSARPGSRFGISCTLTTNTLSGDL